MLIDRNIFCSLHDRYFMVLNQDVIENILTYLESSITQFARGAPDIFSNDDHLKRFLQIQFDQRLDRMLREKNSDIHHLESGMKNKIIQRRENLLNDIVDASHKPPRGN